MNDASSSDLCTGQYTQFKEVVEVVKALGKNAWSCAKDLKDGHFNVSVDEADVYRLGFMLTERFKFFQRLDGFIISAKYVCGIFVFL